DRVRYRQAGDHQLAMAKLTLQKKRCAAEVRGASLNQTIVPYCLRRRQLDHGRRMPRAGRFQVWPLSETASGRRVVQFRRIDRYSRIDAAEAANYQDVSGIRTGSQQARRMAEARSGHARSNREGSSTIDFRSRLY